MRYSRTIAAAALALALAAICDAPLRAEEAAATKGHPMIGEAAPTFDRFYSLLDTANFDAKLIALTAELERLRAAE